MDRKTKIKCGISGAAAGLINGFFGGGGGILLVPLFANFVKLEERETFATSLSVTLPLSVTSVIVYIRRTGLELSPVLPFLLGGIPGAVLAGIFFKKIPTKFLRRLMGVLIILGGLKYLL